MGEPNTDRAAELRALWKRNGLLAVSEFLAPIVGAKAAFDLAGDLLSDLHDAGLWVGAYPDVPPWLEAVAERALLGDLDDPHWWYGDDDHHLSEDSRAFQRLYALTPPEEAPTDG